MEDLKAIIGQVASKLPLWSTGKEHTNGRILALTSSSAATKNVCLLVLIVCDDLNDPLAVRYVILIRYLS